MYVHGVSDFEVERTEFTLNQTRKSCDVIIDTLGSDITVMVDPNIDNPIEGYAEYIKYPTQATCGDRSYGIHELTPCPVAKMDYFNNFEYYMMANGYAYANQVRYNRVPVRGLETIIRINPNVKFGFVKIHTAGGNVRADLTDVHYRELKIEADHGSVDVIMNDANCTSGKFKSYIVGNRDVKVVATHDMPDYRNMIISGGSIDYDITGKCSMWARVYHIYGKIMFNDEQVNDSMRTNFANVDYDGVDITYDYRQVTELQAEEHVYVHGRR
ncbi:hypothetical protein HNP86_001978 [Methanococcus maripaludis]|uniref:Adhesin domain-containing protein n=1 Tax=Methanococcus maripaludis TaxID=39152 RepID=A0A7J9NVW0_METMI|nr:hypothetical protein [Methanococcus maripaludis]MBA2851819.1 hypothetical protein [Methanococcus maripaludis]